jgi:type VI secretion system protein ImpK
MREHSERRATPAAAPAAAPGRLVDLMYDGLVALSLIRNGVAPRADADLAAHMLRFLEECDAGARELGVPAAEVTAAKYAFCAAADEFILRSHLVLRDAWQKQPLQLRVFGDQLAGDHFFVRLEALRARGQAHLASLEVFHLCLLLGFEGRHAMDGDGKLAVLTARLGEDIARMRGAARLFAPHAARPDQIRNKIGRDRSAWLLTLTFAVVGLGAFAAFRTSLDTATEASLASYQGLVRLPPRAANITITVP